MRNAVRVGVIVGCIAVLTGLGACGGGDDDNNSGATNQDSAAFDDQGPSDVSEQDVITALDLVPSGANYDTADGRCEIAVILSGKSQIELYKDAGDPVAENGDGTVGVKVFANDPSVSDADCVDELSSKLDNAF
jgi:hypothetical protein